MLLRPDLNSARIDPTESEPTLKLICDVHDPMTGDNYTRDPRYVATKAENHLRASGIADQAFFGPELEFFLFDHVQFGLRINSSSHVVESDEADWNSSRDEGGNNTGYKIPPKQGYTPVSPFDKLSDIRWEMAEKMGQIGMEFEVHHHEVATGGQGEIAIRFGTLRDKADETSGTSTSSATWPWRTASPRRSCRNPCSATTARACTCTSRSGSGTRRCSSMRTATPSCRSLRATISAAFSGTARRCSPSAPRRPTPTSGWSRASRRRPISRTRQRNRSAAIRIPTYETSAASKRIEFRPPDPSANTYLAFSAMMMAGLDGIRNRIDPGDPTDVDIYELSPEEAGDIPQVPSSLEQAVAALGDDHDYLLEGGVFTQDVIDHYIAFKEQESRDVFMHPVPAEFFHYYHI